MIDSPNAQSIKARLLNMSGGDNKKYQQLVVRYFHERLLFRLSRSLYRNHFILKGGALLYAFEEFVPRPTLDIDFMGTRICNNKSNILDAFRNIVSIECDEDAIQFIPETMTTQDITVEKKYPGVRISFIGTIGTYRQKLTMDIGFGDVIVPRPMELQYPTLLENMEEPIVLAYSLETVVAEKFQTMIDRGRFNSRMKDYFDLFRIFTVHRFDAEQLSAAISATCDNRNTQYIVNHDFFSEGFGDDPYMNQQWKIYKNKMKIELPDFSEMHRIISEILLPFWKEWGER